MGGGVTQRPREIEPEDPPPPEALREQEPDEVPDRPSLDSEFSALCGKNAGLSRKLKHAKTAAERAAIRAEMERNREQMSASGKKVAPLKQARRKEYQDEDEEAARAARRRREGYW